VFVFSGLEFLERRSTEPKVRGSNPLRRNLFTSTFNRHLFSIFELDLLSIGGKIIAK